MRRKLCLLLLLPIVIVSCTNKALEFNNKLVEIQKSVIPHSESFGVKMQQAGDGKIPLKDLDADAKALNIILDTKIAEINKLEVFSGAEDFKAAVLDQLKFEKNICIKTSVLASDTASMLEKLKIAQEFEESEPVAKRLEDAIVKTQQEFAKKHNFKIENK